MLRGRRGGTRVRLGVVLTGVGVHGAAGVGVLSAEYLCKAGYITRK